MIDITIIIGPVVLVAGAFVLGGETLVPVGAAVGAMYTLWNLARRTSSWEMKLDAHADTIKTLAETSRCQRESLTVLREFMITRPCLMISKPCEETDKADIAKRANIVSDPKV